MQTQHVRSPPGVSLLSGCCGLWTAWCRHMEPGSKLATHNRVLPQVSPTKALAMTATVSPLLTAVQGIVCLRVLISNGSLTAGLLPGALMLHGASVQHSMAPLPCRCFASFCLTFFRQSLCRTQVTKAHPEYCCKLLAKQFCGTCFMHAKSKGMTGTSRTWKER